MKTGMKDTGWMGTGVRRDPRSYGKMKVTQADVDKLRKAFVHAVRKALTAGFDTMHEDTGMTRGSLIPAADEVGNRMISAYAGARERNGWTDMGGTYHPGELRNAERGTAEGEGYTVIEYGRIRSLVFRFSQAINIYQWAKYEGSWDVLSVMEAAFMESISEELDGVFADPHFIRFGG